MSSESNGQKPESAAPPSGVVHRVSARAPSAWGAVRDALAALHNIAALLRNSNVPHRTILELVPELRSSGIGLRGVFDRPETEPAAAGVDEYGGGLVLRLDALLDALAASVDGSDDREKLASSGSALADELEACADLLALLDRAAAPASTEVSLNLVARESGRMSGATRGREMIVRFEEASPDCVISTDPYVLGQLLSLMAAFAHAAGVREPVLRARSAPQPQFVVEGAEAADASLPALSLRVTPWVLPSAAAARRVAGEVGAALGLEDVRCSIVLGIRAG